MSVRRALGVLSVKPGVCAVQVRRKVVGAVGKTQFVASADDDDLLNAVYEAALRAREVAMERVKSAVLKENEASASPLTAIERADKLGDSAIVKEMQRKHWEKEGALRMHRAERLWKERADLKKADAEYKKAKKALLASSGPVRAYTVFIQVTLKGTSLTMKEANAQWQALSAERREMYAPEAAANRERRANIRTSLKRPLNDYARFTKEHYSALHAAAKHQGLLEGLGKEGLPIVSRMVAQKYRAEQRALSLLL